MRKIATCAVGLFHFLNTAKNIQIAEALSLGIRIAAGTDLRYTNNELSMADKA